VFDKIDQHLPALASMLFRWEQDLKLPIRANAFYTPCGSSGFHRHYDTHDVIVIQVRGTKTWDVCDDPLPIPHEEQQRMSSHYAANARLIARVDLRPGDIAYLPRGFVHAAAASDTDTLHLSVSIRNRSLRDVLSVALRAKLLDDETHRRSVRLDFIDPEAILAAILADIDAIDIRAAMAEVRSGFLRQRVRSDRRLDAIDFSSSIDDCTALSVASDAVFSLEAAADSTAIEAIGERRRLMFDAAEAIGFAFAAGRFLVRELPLPSAEQRVALARELHLAGLASVQST
jgi:lysine-specific demethylase/histidyl-hydroxylase NO66